MAGRPPVHPLRVAALALMLIGTLPACGGAPIATTTPSPSASPTPTPSPASSPSPAVVTAGSPAWVDVSVASGWRSRSAPRPVDTPALQNPAAVRAWLTGMTAADKVGLIDRLDTQLLLGERVEVLEVDGDWTRIAVPDQPAPADPRGYPVWVPLRQLTALPPPDTGELVTVVTPTAVLRSADGTIEVSFGTTLPLVGGAGAIDIVGLPGGHGSMTVAATAVTAAGLTPTGASIVATARRFLGLPYLWGGTSGFGFDCSGLVHLIYRAHGVVLPRDSDPQSKAAVAVSRSDLQPGDLVFFSSGGVAYHVALYAGSGLIIDSPSPGYAVEEIPLASMPIAGDYSGARRPQAMARASRNAAEAAMPPMTTV